MTKQFMLIVPGKGRRLPKAWELKAAGFIVSSALGSTLDSPQAPARDETDDTQHHGRRGDKRGK